MNDLYFTAADVVLGMGIVGLYALVYDIRLKTACIVQALQDKGISCNPGGFKDAIDA